jgi:hypothetical protein
MADEDFCDSLFEDDDADADAFACAHWHDRALCAEACSCGHACGEHYRWGGCALCTCIAWEEARDAVYRQLPARPVDADEDAEDWDEAAGF